MRCLPAPCALATLAALTALVTTAPARADGIVLESYTGARGDEVNRLLSPILEELAVRKFIGGYDAVGRKFEREVSRPAVSAEGLPADFADQIEKGHRLWIGGKFNEAVSALDPMIDAALANPGAFAQNQPLRDRLLKGLIALALSQDRMGDPSAARATFGEILRTYPDTILSAASYGHPAYVLFEQVRKELGASGRGRLAVKPSIETAVVFVNEHFDAVGAISRSDLLPGDYRVYLQVGPALSRSHRVEVAANGAAELEIDVAFDRAIHTGRSWTGLQFATAADRERLEALYAARFANQVGATAVAVVGIDKVGGRKAIVGALISLETGREIRRASIAVDPDPPVERLRALARFLAGEEAARGLDVVIAHPAPHPAAKPTPTTATATGAATAPTADPAPDAAAASDEHVDEPARGGHGWGGYKYLTGGAAIVALGAGATLIAIDGSCSSTATPGLKCPDVYNTKTPGFVAVGAGVALAAVTAYLWLRHSDGDARTAFIAPTGDGAIAGYAGRF